MHYIVTKKNSGRPRLSTHNMHKLTTKDLLEDHCRNVIVRTAKAWSLANILQIASKEVNLRLYSSKTALSRTIVLTFHHNEKQRQM